MEDTIIALLNNNLRVIIPDFGAFIIRQKQPRIIVFNEFLRYNDGILIDFIVKTEGIDRDIAEQRVLDFAEDGTKLLASGRELVIEGLGSLRKDSSGKINFIELPANYESDKKSTVVQDINSAGEEFHEIPPVSGREIPAKSKARSTAGKKSIAAKTTPERKSKTKASTVKISGIEAAVEPQAVEAATEKVPISVAAEPAVIEAAAELPVIGESNEPAAIEALQAESASIDEVIEPAVMEKASTVPVGKNFEPAPIRKPVIEIPPVSKPSPAEKPSSYTDQPAPVQTNRILAWILLILFVNAVILSWFVFRKKTHEKSAGKSEITAISDTINDQLADSVRAATLDSRIIFNEVPENEGNQAESAQTPGSRYYIVAGCFRDEINADSLVTTLKHLGYKAEKFGKIGNLYAVCFASFDDKEKAVPELKKIREKVPSAWMTKF